MTYSQKCSVWNLFVLPLSRYTYSALYYRVYRFFGIVQSAWTMSCFLDFFSIHLSSVAVEGNFSSGGSKFGNTQQTNDVHCRICYKWPTAKQITEFIEEIFFNTVIVKYKLCYYNILLLVLYNSWLKYQNTYQLLYIAKN